MVLVVWVTWGFNLPTTYLVLTLLPLMVTLTNWKLPRRKALKF